MPNETFEVGTRRGIEWRVMLRPSETDRFPAGQYLVNIELSDDLAARSAIRRTQMSVLASPARNDAERADEFYSLGRRALANGHLLEARGYLQRARATRPGTSIALFELAVIHLRLKEYREAIATFEQLPPIQDRSPIPVFLAQAYVGVGDEGKAAQVLLRTGMNSRDVASELDRLRRLVRR
jgi:tetratricopeptide (TPR) repeat protein